MVPSQAKVPAAFALQPSFAVQAVPAAGAQLPQGPLHWRPRSVGQASTSGGTGEEQLPLHCVVPVESSSPHEFEVVQTLPIAGSQHGAGSGALHVPPKKAPFVVSVLHTFVFEQAQPSIVGAVAQVGGGGISQKYQS